MPMSLRVRGMRYGAVPIAHRTGALADVVHPYVLETAKGEGFTFGSGETHGLP